MGSFEKKHLTEEATCLDINYLARRRLLTVQPHRIGWSRRAVWAEVFLGENIEELFVRMHCPSSDPNDPGTLYVIPLVLTQQRLGGRRRWLKCYLCGSRVAKLYIPPSKIDWGCRVCHGLTYRSCREAHRAERMHCKILRIFTKCGSLLHDE